MYWKLYQQRLQFGGTPLEIAGQYRTLDKVGPERFRQMSVLLRFILISPAYPSSMRMTRSQGVQGQYRAL